MTEVYITRTGTEVVMYCIVYLGLVQGQKCIMSYQSDWYCRINRTGTGVVVECIISVGLVLGLYHISRTDTGTGFYCVVSVELILGQ